MKEPKILVVAATHTSPPVKTPCIDAKMIFPGWIEMQLESSSPREPNTVVYVDVSGCRLIEVQANTRWLIENNRI